MEPLCTGGQRRDTGNTNTKSNHCIEFTYEFRYNDTMITIYMILELLCTGGQWRDTERCNDTGDNY